MGQGGAQSKLIEKLNKDIQDQDIVIKILRSYIEQNNLDNEKVII